MEELIILKYPIYMIIKLNLPDIYEGSTDEEPQHIGSSPFHCQY